MTTDDIKYAHQHFDKWLDHEQAERLPDDQLETIREAAHKEIDADPEYWWRNGWWKLFDKIRFE